MPKKIPYLISFVDKEDPFSHSFVNDFLLEQGSNIADFSHVVYSKNKLKSETIITNIRGVKLVNFLAPRRGLLRFINVFLVFLYVIRCKRLGHSNISILVRNCPFILFGAFLTKLFKISNKLSYQSSFPHEENLVPLVKKIYIIILRLMAFKVDSLLAVSPLGLNRIEAIFGNYPSRGAFIPLCTNSPKQRNEIKNPDDVVRFVYAGTFSEERQLDKVINGFLIAQPTSSKSLLYLFGVQKKNLISLLVS